MLIFIILIGMIYMHIIDDYVLQGILASMKQKSWWEKNAPDQLYKNDYKIALIEHALSWTISIHIPIILYIIFSGNIDIFDVKLVLFIILLIIQCIIHAVVDNLKANMHKINLIEDQCIHFYQILTSWIVFICCYIVY